MWSRMKSGGGGGGGGGGAWFLPPAPPPPAPLPPAPCDLEPYQSVVRFRPAIPVELPRVAHLADFLEVELRGDEGVLVALAGGEELAARIAEVALPVKLADVPRPFVADAVDGADEVAVGDSVRGLLEFPEILGEAGDGRGRIEHDLRAVQPELARPLGEVPVVADVDADLAVRRVEDWVAEVAGTEVELLPEAGGGVRDMILSILTEVGAVGVDDGGGVVVNAGALFFIERHDDDHLVLFGVLLHELRGRAVGDLLDGVVPARVLLGAEVRTGEDLLHAEHLHAFLAGLIDVLERALDLGVANGLDRLAAVGREGGLDQTALHDSGHFCFLRFGFGDYRGLRTED